MNLLTGTSGFSYKEWKPSFYPADLAARQMLSYYASRFPAVEINNSFYRMPAESVLQEWTTQVPPEFRFILKAPRRITHISRLKDVGDSVALFLRVSAALGTQRGPLLFQLPPNLKKDAARLGAFLELLPGGTRAAIEFRNETWFDDETFEQLRSHNVALCLAETGEEGDAPRVATASWGYLRLRKVEYSEEELQNWAQYVHAQQWDDAHVFFKHEDAGTGPRLAAHFTEIFNE